MKYLPLFTLLLAASAPFAASAATFPPYCAVLTKTGDGHFWPMINNKLYLVAQVNEPITIIWGSANATKAYTDQGYSVDFNGQQVVTPTQTTSYAYHFASDTGVATCTVTAVVLGAGNTWPGNTSTATQTTTSVNTVPTQPAVTTTSPTSSSSPSTASFSVSEIPLLTGGLAAPGTVVPVQYLKLVNTSNTKTTLPGVWVKQSGTAPVSAVIGFSTVDDKGSNRLSTGGKEGSTPFVNGLAFVPLDADFDPGQFRIFTIKAQLSQNLSASAGTTLLIKLAKLDTTGKIASTPINGAVWTLSAY